MVQIETKPAKKPSILERIVNLITVPISAEACPRANMENGDCMLKPGYYCSNPFEFKKCLEYQKYLQEQNAKQIAAGSN